MLCEKCHHCGLCEGDGKSEDSSNMQISVDGLLPFEPCGGAIADARICIAVDIGTTTIAASSYAMSSEKRLSYVCAVNEQRSFGKDVLSRIAFSSEAHNGILGQQILHEKIVLQINALLSKLISQTTFLLPRGFRVEVAEIAITGNTTMLSFAFNLDATPLATAPFTPPSLFGASFLYGDFLASVRVPFAPVPLSTPIFVPPCISAFVGADTVCALTACGFGADNSARMLADVGTNCEMAIQSSAGKITCTASAAGPAFEGYGISAGMSAASGAIADVSVHSDGLGGKALACSVIGGARAKGICGTGLLSALGAFLELGLLSFDGAISGDADRILLRDGVFLLQSDIRAVQLAKSAVKTGLDFLLERAGENAGIQKFFLAGSFGTKLKITDAVKIKMIPSQLAPVALSAGNAALSGAAAVLLRKELRVCAKKIAENAECVNLAEVSDFQERFLSNLAL